MRHVDRVGLGVSLLLTARRCGHGLIEMSATVREISASPHEADGRPMSTPDAALESHERPAFIPLLDGDLTGSLDSDRVPGWWLSEPIPERRLLSIALPCISPRGALRALTSFLVTFAFAVVATTIIVSLLYAFMPGAGTVIVSLPGGQLRLANELTFVILASTITIRFARVGIARRPRLFFVGLLLEINLFVALDALLLS